ncbi:glycosyltransferase family 2 protein [Phreatobacter sp.]|uniref:glycosyltransferase family 2 protein n=1 Tax=Phreatobacter sp. TaxID=1966341 RepID=UPI003F7087A4
MTFSDIVERNAPDYVRAVLAEHGRAVLTPLSLPRAARQIPEQPVVISVVKDEADRLDDFLRHYRTFGIERFVFVDNGSTDGTVDLLCAQPDCEVLQIKGAFHWMRKQGWITLAIDKVGRSRDAWYIYVDADEHIVFEGMERRSFADLCVWAEARQISRIRGMLIDMYSDGPLLGSSYRAGQRLVEAYPFFDDGGYDEQQFREIISRKGGPRQRVFGKASASFRPEMTKYPVFKLSGHDIFANPHHVWPYEPNFVSPCVLGLLHFKFLPDTIRRIDEAVRAQNYWGGSIEYKCYRDILTQNPELSLIGDVSRLYESPMTLIEAGLVLKIED